MRRTDLIIVAVIVLGGMAFLGLIFVTGAWREGYDWVKANILL